MDDDPLLQLVGSGKQLWADEDPDECVRLLRDGWDEAASEREGRPQPPSHSLPDKSPS
jgi:hypothetical protein